MTKYHSGVFFENVIKPNMTHGVLLLDSWGGQKKEIFDTTRHIRIETIPLNTTGFAQPDSLNPIKTKHLYNSIIICTRKIKN